MNKLIAATIACAFALPAVSFAQSSGAVTRGEVGSELVALQQVGPLDSGRDYSTYPSALQAAEANAPATSTSYGNSIAGTSQAGNSTSSVSPGSTYFGR